MLGALKLRSPVIALVLLAGCGSAASQAQAEHQREAEWCKSAVYARGQLEALRQHKKAGRGERWRIHPSFPFHAGGSSRDPANRRRPNLQPCDQLLVKRCAYAHADRRNIRALGRKVRLWRHDATSGSRDRRALGG